MRRNCLTLLKKRSIWLRLVEERAEADRGLAVGLGRDVSPSLSLDDGIAQGVGIISLIGE